MLAAVLADRRRLELRDVPLPKPGAGEVLCRVGYAGICGSDLHAYRDLTFAIGTVMGHEAVGFIEAVGPGVPADRIGERVVLRPAFACGECRYCEAGAVNLCVDHIGKSIGTGAAGAFAEYVAVRSSMAVALPDGVDDVDATLIEPLACAVHAVRRSVLRLGDRVAVLGAGPIGLLVIAAARAAGAIEVVAWERAPRRRALARDFGADEVRGDLESVESGEFDIVFECAGHQTAPAAAATLARKGGQVVLVAMGTAEAPLLEFQWVVKELDVVASINCRPEEFRIALDLVRRRVLDAGRMVSAVIDLERIERDGFRALDDPDGAVKILVRPRTQPAPPRASA